MPETHGWYTGLVNLAKYPLLDKAHPQYKKQVEKAKNELSECGAAEMTDFLTAEGVEKLKQDSVAIEGSAYWNALIGNAYLDEPDASLPEDHARKIVDTTSLGAVGYDQFPTQNLLRQIYEWEAFIEFIREIVELKALYRYADPMGALNLSVMKDGDYLRWHFDQSDFVTSLSVRNAEQGGAFEYVPRLRSKENENYDRVRAVLKGSRDGVVHVPNKPGTLLVFQGRYSLHRVTPVQGKTSRLMGLFGYAAEPGVMSSEYLRKIRYGRVEPVTQKSKA